MPVVKDKALILGPDGSVANIPTTYLTLEEVKLLREYKKFLLRHHLKEAIRCNECFENNRAQWAEAWVTNADIMIRCQCSCLFHKGAIY
jgi:hypothetical protein